MSSARRRSLSVLCTLVRPSRLTAVSISLALVAAVPATAWSQARPDSSTKPSMTAATAAAGQAIVGAIELCVVPGSGTAYRVGAPGLPTQCVSPTHTSMSLNLLGPQGPQGERGATGDAGAAGAAGPKGEPGAAGADGTPGVNGAPGVLGPAGAVGAAGPAGAPGVAGPAGAIGPEGPIGEKGLPGAAGAPGLAGVPGTSGATDHNALTNLLTDSHTQYLTIGHRVTNNGFSVSGTQGQGTPTVSGAGARLMYFAGKSALRVGNVNANGASFWDAGLLGNNSVAYGYNTRASAYNAFAGGHESNASGAESFAIGNGATASGTTSFAQNGYAGGDGAIAMGYASYSLGSSSVAIGQGSNASANRAISIGQGNADGEGGMAIGMNNRANGVYSTALGTNASTNGHSGAFVIGAGWDDPFYTNVPAVIATADNQFVVRGAGGIVLYTTNDMSTGVSLAAGGGSWSTLSDRNRKQDVLAVDGEALLQQLGAIPVSTWRYKAQTPTVRHIGPMAQDWERTFGLSGDSTTINSGDIAGVTLAGVQALHARTQAMTDRVVALEARIVQLERQLTAILSASSTGHGTGGEISASAAKRP